MVAVGGTAVLVGAVVLALSAVALCLTGAVLSAVNAYLQTLLYRYAVDLPVPGVDRHWMPPQLPA